MPPTHVLQAEAAAQQLHAPRLQIAPPARTNKPGNAPALPPAAHTLPPPPPHPAAPHRQVIVFLLLLSILAGTPLAGPAGAGRRVHGCVGNATRRQLLLGCSALGWRCYEAITLAIQREQLLLVVLKVPGGQGQGALGAG